MGSASARSSPCRRSARAMSSASPGSSGACSRASSISTRQVVVIAEQVGQRVRLVGRALHRRRARPRAAAAGGTRGPSRACASRARPPRTGSLRTARRALRPCRYSALEAGAHEVEALVPNSQASTSVPPSSMASAASLEALAHLGVVRLAREPVALRPPAPPGAARRAVPRPGSARAGRPASSASPRRRGRPRAGARRRGSARSPPGSARAPARRAPGEAGSAASSCPCGCRAPRSRGPLRPRRGAAPRPSRPGRGPRGGCPPPAPRRRAADRRAR